MISVEFLIAANCVCILIGIYFGRWIEWQNIKTIISEHEVLKQIVEGK